MDKIDFISCCVGFSFDNNNNSNTDIHQMPLTTLIAESKELALTKWEALVCLAKHKKVSFQIMLENVKIVRESLKVER